MFVEAALEKCTDRGDACLINGQTSSSCQDCDGLGSVGALPCGRCAGTGLESTSPDAAGVHRGVRADCGAIGNWRSREWLLDRHTLRGSRRQTSTWATTDADPLPVRDGRRCRHLISLRGSPACAQPSSLATSRGWTNGWKSCGPGRSRRTPISVRAGGWLRSREAMAEQVVHGAPLLAGWYWLDELVSPPGGLEVRSVGRVSRNPPVIASQPCRSQACLNPLARLRACLKSAIC